MICMEKIVHDTRTKIVASLIAGATLVGAGIVAAVLRPDLSQFGKTLVSLSFIPFAVSLSHWLNICLLRRRPQAMRPFVVAESDERLIAQRNEAEAAASRVMRFALYLTFLGYSLLVPADVFVAAGWWILLALLFVSYALPMFMLYRMNAADDRTK
jgi:hypothetical protein